MRRYRKNYKDALRWSVLAVLLIIALPFVLGIANYVNEHFAAQEVIAYEIKSDNDLIAEPTENPYPYKIAALVEDPDGLHQAEQSVFWNANESWNEFIVNTGASSTDNTSAENRLFFNWNISAKEMLDKNVNKIVIKLKGLNRNTSFRCRIIAVDNGKIPSSTEGVNLLNINNIYTSKTYTLSNTTSANIVLSIDPATLAYAAEHTNSTNSHIRISFISCNPANDFFGEGQTIYFQIYALKPHGGITIDGKSFVDAVAEIYGVVFIIAAVFATGAVNPTHKHVFGHLYYGIKRYIKLRRKRRYHKIRSKIYGHHRRRYRW